MKKDYGHALADIRQVLKREPRHFGALAGFGLILQDIGDDKQALEVYRRALAPYPRMERIPDLVKSLQEKVEGRNILRGVRAVPPARNPPPQETLGACSHSDRPRDCQSRLTISRVGPRTYPPV